MGDFRAVARATEMPSGEMKLADLDGEGSLWRTLTAHSSRSATSAPTWAVLWSKASLKARP